MILFWKTILKFCLTMKYHNKTLRESALIKKKLFNAKFLVQINVKIMYNCCTYTTSIFNKMYCGN